MRSEARDTFFFKTSIDFFLSFSNLLNCAVDLVHYLKNAIFNVLLSLSALLVNLSKLSGLCLGFDHIVCTIQVLSFFQSEVKAQFTVNIQDIVLQFSF